MLGFDRVVFIPSIPVTLSQLEAALLRVTTSSSHPKLGKVNYAVDEALSAAVASFPTKVDCSRAVRLGMPSSLDVDELLREYASDFPDALAPGVEMAPPSRKRGRGEGEGPWTVALVTGGGSGIGREVCERLASRASWVREGSRGAVVLAGRRGAALEETVAGMRGGMATLCVPTDVTDEKQASRASGHSL